MCVNASVSMNTGVPYQRGWSCTGARACWDGWSPRHWVPALWSCSGRTERASGEPWSWSQEPQSDCARRRSGGVRPHTGSGTLTRQEHKVIQKASLHPTDISRSLEVSRTLDRAVVFISRCPSELNASRSRIRQLQIGRRSRLLCRVKYH